MPVNTSRHLLASGGRNTNFIKDKENSENGEMATPFNLPHLTKFSGHINEDPDRFFYVILTFSFFAIVGRYETERAIADVSSGYSFGLGIPIKIPKSFRRDNLRTVER